MCEAPKQKRSMWLRGLLAVGWVVAMWGVMSVTACGPGLPGTIEVVDTPVNTPATALAMLGKHLYVVYEDGKMRVYDISDPAKPERKEQIDAFAGPHVGMVTAFGDRRLLLFGQDGKVAIFDLADPQKPRPMWGNGKTLALFSKTGPFLIYPSTNAMYMTPGGGTSLVRADLTLLDTTDMTSIDASTVSKSFTAGSGGGGGIAIIYDDKGSPVRLYVGSASSAKMDVWIIPDLEGGSTDPKPTSVDLTNLGKVSGMFSYKKTAGAIQGWLLLAGDPTSEKDFDVLDLGRHWTDAASPASIGTANVDDPYRLDAAQNIIVTKTLSVFDISEGPEKPAQVAKLALNEVPEVRDMLIHNEYIYSAERVGLRIYKYTKGATSK